jgi:tRNA isopentenyl-2-thiomethyl-A-37 hydroxylase MiaE
VPVAAEPVVAEVQKPSNSKAETAEVVTAALTAQHKGDALAAAITSGYAAKDVTLPISIFAVVSTIIQHVAASPEAFSGKWYKPEEYGAALKAVMSGRSLKEQIDGLYAVQDYCSRNRFPKLDVKGKQKKLIEVIMTALLVSEVVDVDTILAWADDEADRDDVPGRVDAIVQMTAMLTTLREPDDVEEEDLDEEALTRQYVR